MNSPVAILKKYKNRRIYDGRCSRYVNMEEVRCMFLNRENIRIVDGSSADDLTAQMLLQLLQQEEKSACALPLELLQNALVAGEKGEGASFKEKVCRALRDANLLSVNDEELKGDLEETSSVQEREVARLRGEVRAKLSARLSRPDQPVLDPLAGSASVLEPKANL